MWGVYREVEGGPPLCSGGRHPRQTSCLVHLPLFTNVPGEGHSVSTDTKTQTPLPLHLRDLILDNT
jgi:hypothetical protein